MPTKIRWYRRVIARFLFDFIGVHVRSTLNDELTTVCQETAAVRRESVEASEESDARAARLTSRVIDLESQITVVRDDLARASHTSAEGQAALTSTDSRVNDLGVAVTAVCRSVEDVVTAVRQGNTRVANLLPALDAQVAAVRREGQSAVTAVHEQITEIEASVRATVVENQKVQASAVAEARADTQRLEKTLKPAIQSLRQDVATLVRRESGHADPLPTPRPTSARNGNVISDLTKKQFGNIVRM